MKDLPTPDVLAQIAATLLSNPENPWDLSEAVQEAFTLVKLSEALLEKEEQQ